MKFLLFLIVVLLLVPIFADALGGGTPNYAGCGYPLLSPDYCQIACYGLMQTPCAFRTCCWVAKVGHWMEIAGLVLALIIVIVAGILYMVSGGNETKVGTAKKTLLYGLVGAAIVLMAGYIIATLAEFLV